MTRAISTAAWTPGDAQRPTHLEMEFTVTLCGLTLLGNCITSFEGRIAAVLDWEIATLGDPLADVGYVLHSWPERGEAGPAHRMSPTSTPGFPTRSELLDRYAARSGRDVSGIDFYVAFSHWKSACIVEGVYARYLGGATGRSDVDFSPFKHQVERVAGLAEAAVNRLP